ncbi:unnamed protein product (macronuclear) [Paramecium tetraurelia]|uniref:Uncharacterized protein n=1 Tax=Paramecium tetraurelia TaxID=5888 RepID=A0EDZ7_PARTE|nr:uncharacterized protein GSPATT00025858001 [Paramecium tetraurelia]CAK93514.1 unnamed protein product [Paramecium tetraurelia]|eukprot:XP_001460911.1 hypothetical protein (macronuclear) [Paramecium tetraurelia strain d4-2]
MSKSSKSSRNFNIYTLQEAVHPRVNIRVQVQNRNQIHIQIKVNHTSYINIQNTSLSTTSTLSTSRKIMPPCLQFVQESYRHRVERNLREVWPN